MNRSQSSTRWDRTYIRERFMQRIHAARAVFFNDYDAIGSLPVARGISHTVLPTGEIITSKTKN